MAMEDWFLSRARVAARPHKRVRLDDKTAFFQQLATLLGSGTPLLQALKVCAEQSQSVRLRLVLEEVAARVAAGTPLHAAAAYYPQVFDHDWVEVLRTGEMTGQMGLVLTELNRQIAEARDTRRKVVGALIYPCVLIVVSVVSVAIMLWLVVPTFASMFRDLGAQLPEVTRMVIDSSTFLVDNGPYLLLALGLVAWLARRHGRTEAGRRLFESAGLALPLVGELLVQMAMYRFASTLALLLKSGIPMMEALTVLGRVFQMRPIYGQAISRAQSRVASGQPLAASLEETGLFTTMLTNMVRVGEESGQLADVMSQVAPFYKEKMEAMVAKVTKLLEPVIIVGMGGAVAALMLAIYLPMFDMAGKVH